MNIGKSGASFSTGVKGASVTLGKNGIYSNVGIPGTGFSNRNKVLGFNSNKSNKEYRVQALNLEVEPQLNDAGELILFKGGAQLDDDLHKRALSQNKDIFLSWLNGKCEDLNKITMCATNFHYDTSDPKAEPVRYEKVPFNEFSPTKKAIRNKAWWSIFLWGGWKKEHLNKIKKINDTESEEYEVELRSWMDKKNKFEKEQHEHEELINTKRYSDKESMKKCLELFLSEIDFPRETLVSLEIEEDLTTLWLDVDLPEIEELPIKIAKVQKRPLGIKYKEKSETCLRKEYKNIVHSILFKITGESFFYLPNIDKIFISGYSQRADKKSGQIKDEYLISAEIVRDIWSSINFKGLENIDVVDTFELFNLIRKMTAGGIFKPIVPFEYGKQ